MKNKYMGYIDEKKDFSTTIISFLSLLIVYIVMIINVSFNIEILVFTIFIIFMIIIVFFNDVKYYLNYKKRQKFKTMVSGVDGYIESFECWIERIRKKRRVRCILVVSYIDPIYGKKIYKTPIINFNVIKDLGSRKCKVYFFDNEVYVSDFIRRMPNDSYVWDDDIIKNCDPKKILLENELFLLGSLGKTFLFIILVLLCFTLLI